MTKTRSRTFVAALGAVMLFTSLMPASAAGPTWNTRGDVDVDGDYVRLNSTAFSNAYAWQDFEIDNLEGDWVVLSAWVNAESVRTEGNITGRPYLYGYLFGEDGRIDTYMQGQNMMRVGQSTHDWVPVYGIFPREEGQDKVRMFLKQGRRRGSWNNGTDVAFLHPQVSVFETEMEALNVTGTMGDAHIYRDLWNNPTSPFDEEPVEEPAGPTHQTVFFNNYRLVKLQNSAAIWAVNYDDQTRHVFINEATYKTWDPNWSQFITVSDNYLNYFEEAEPALPKNRYVRAVGDPTVWWSNGVALYPVNGQPQEQFIVNIPSWMQMIYNM